MPVSDTDDFDRELEGYEEVATDFGTKIEWKEGVTFSGTFDGYKAVKDKETGDTIQAARFTDDSPDSPYWSWQPFQLESALLNIKPGTEVIITCLGEDDEAPHRKGGNKQLAFAVRKRA